MLYSVNVTKTNIVLFNKKAKLKLNINIRWKILTKKKEN